MPLPGSSGTSLIAYYNGNPTNAAITAFNEPIGTLVIDYSTPAAWIKTSPLNDNSGFSGTVGSTLTAPIINGGLTASGSAANTFAGSTGTFITSTGANTLSGTTTVAANKNLLFTTGTSAADFSLGTGIFKTTSGTTTIVGALQYTTQALSGSGAVDIITPTTKLTTTGGSQALTLANGADGQIKTIIHDVDGGSAILTPTTKTGFSTITFTNAGDTATLQYATTRGWFILALNGATAA